MQLVAGTNVGSRYLLYWKNYSLVPYAAPAAVAVELKGAGATADCSG